MILSILIGALILGIGVIIGASVVLAAYQRIDANENQLNAIADNLAEHRTAIAQIEQNQVAIVEGVNIVGRSQAALESRVAFWITDKN